MMGFSLALAAQVKATIISLPISPALLCFFGLMVTSLCRDFQLQMLKYTSALPLACFSVRGDETEHPEFICANTKH